MKKHIDLNWLKGKSEAEQRQLLDDKQEVQTWYGYPRVDAKEAEALRNGKPYRPTDFDIERLTYVYDMGFSGSPETDPLVIKCLAKGFITENPKWREEEDRIAARIAELVAQYGPGNYSVGVGNGYGRWALTDAGKAFVRQLAG